MLQKKQNKLKTKNKQKKPPSDRMTFEWKPSIGKSLINIYTPRE